MKIILRYFFFSILLLCFSNAYSQGTWAQKASYPGVNTTNPAVFNIGTKIYLATGTFYSETARAYSNPTWQYDAATNVWTQMVDFGGSFRHGSTAFAIGSYGYVGLGVEVFSGNFATDFWRFDPVNNVWLQIGIFPGSARTEGFSFTINNKAYVGGGLGVGSTTPEFWEYSPTTNTWTKKANYPLAYSLNGIGFSIANKGYAGTGNSPNGFFTKDLFEYDPLTDKWTKKADLAGPAHYSCFAMTINGKAYVGGGVDESNTIAKDCWVYNPTVDAWAKVADYAGGTKSMSLGVGINGAGYVLFGSSDGGRTNSPEVWQYTPDNMNEQAIISPGTLNKVMTDTDFDPGATTTSGLPVTYSSSNATVATIVNNKVHIVDIGTVTIMASQAGNATYRPATNVTFNVVITKASQTINFPAISTKNYGDTPFDPAATASSGLTITYQTNNGNVAAINSGKITINGVGTTIITATQPGDRYYNSASATQTITVNKANQTINFAAIPDKTTLSGDFTLSATSSSGLPVTYTGNNSNVATITGSNVHILGAGSITITALQNGNVNYNAATSVNQTFTVTIPPAITYPTGTTYSLPIGQSIIPIAANNTGGAIPAVTKGTVTTLAGSGIKSYVNATGAAAGFGYTNSMVTDSFGNIFVTDGGNLVIRKITPQGVVSTFAGSGNAAIVNGTGTGASFYYPETIAIDASNNLYVSDNSIIRKITPAGVVTTFAGRAGPGFADGTGTAAAFDYPQGMAFDHSGNLIVADGQGIIRKITPAAVVTTIAGSVTYPSGTQPTFALLAGLAIDANDNIYVAEGNPANIIKKITPAGVVSTFAGNGTAGWVDGPASSASFNFPYRLAFDDANNLYVTEAVNNTIRMITPAGVVSTFAGSTTAGSANGTGASASFYDPTGIVFDHRGNLYIADDGNFIIRKIQIPGYSITPALPLGLVFNGATGAITGTPLAPTSSTQYIITASNGVNTGSATLTISTNYVSPTITSFTPTTAVSGNTVTITGTNFYGVTAVNFGATAATSFVVNSATSITAVVANGTSGAVTVTNPAGTATLAGFNYIFVLPATTFKLTTTSASCKGNANGAVNITATTSLNYTATITGNGVNASYPFTTTVDINSLAAGSYNICLTVAGQSSYQQCFTVVITEPKDLSLYTSVSKTTNQVTLSMDGASVYNINFNGSLVTNTTGQITLPLKNGTNNITVSTDKPCQGQIESSLINGGKTVYPNPFENTFYLNLGDNIIKNSRITIFDPSNRLVYNQQYTNRSGVVRVDINQGTPGLYMVKLIADGTETVYKIIKK